jgi:hypothetical protein
MRAKAPLDVDLEDKLLYGLTPMRLSYLVVGLLAGFALWSTQWAPSPLRAVASLVVVGVGAATAWGRWRGRAIDAWVGDIGLFILNTHRLEWRADWLPRFKHRANQAPLLAPAGPVEILVIGRAPGAGASTVAAELAACLCAIEPSQPRWSVTAVPMGHKHKPGVTRRLLSVVAVDAGHVCYLDCGAGPSVAAWIPEDEHVRQAARLKQPTVVAFPDAAASRAFKGLADVVAAAG